MKTITLLQPDGGTGKTTVALNLAYGLCNRGKNVLLIDTDSQANLTETLLGNQLSSGDQSSAYFLNNLPTGLEGILISISDRLSLIGSDPGHNPMLDRDDTEFTIIPYYLRNLLQECENDFDYCIIDTPSRMGFFTQEAMVAADSLIITLSAANHHSVFNFDRLLRAINHIQEEYNPDLYIEGILITCFSERRQLDRELKASIETIAESLQIPVFPSPIHKTIKQVEANCLGLSIFEHCPESSLVQDYQDMINQILEKEFSTGLSEKEEDSFFSSQGAFPVNRDLSSVSENEKKIDDFIPPRKKELRTERIQVVITPKLKKEIARRSKKAGLTQSDYVYHLLLHYLKWE